MEEHYLVLFEGEVRTGESVRDVRKELMERFRIAEDRLERLFSGQRVVVFKSDVREKADDFAKRFASTGAICRIEVEYPQGYCPPKCSQCGSIIPSEGATCSSCEKKKAAKAKESQEEPVDAAWESADSSHSSKHDEASPFMPLWKVFTGPRSEWYAERFARFSTNSSPTAIPTWNWGAFLFGIAWLLYRKMYGLAFLFFGISTAGIVIPGGSLAVSIFFGFFANYLYYQHVKKRVNAIVAASDKINPEEALTTLGGVNPIPRVIAIFFVMLGLMAIFGAQFFDLSGLTPPQ